jgi:hypothetical protein
MMARWYWMEEEERMCRMCHGKREAIEHMWSGCGELREREGKEREQILREDGRKRYGRGGKG